MAKVKVDLSHPHGKALAGETVSVESDEAQLLVRTGRATYPNQDEAEKVGDVKGKP